MSSSARIIEINQNDIEYEELEVDLREQDNCSDIE
jgi:hypothetical protein